MVQHMVRGTQFRCLVKVWQNGVVLGLADLQGPVHGSTLMAAYIQLLHLRNGRDCLMFTPQANMKMTIKEITTGNSGNGNTDNPHSYILACPLIQVCKTSLNCYVHISASLKTVDRVHFRQLSI